MGRFSKTNLALKIQEEFVPPLRQKGSKPKKMGQQQRFTVQNSAETLFLSPLCLLIERSAGLSIIQEEEEVSLSSSVCIFGERKRGGGGLISLLFAVVFFCPP